MFDYILLIFIYKYELVLILPNGAALVYPKRESDSFFRIALTYLPNYKCRFPEDRRRNLTNNMGEGGKIDHGY